MSTLPTANPAELELRRQHVIALALTPGATLSRLSRLLTAFPPDVLINAPRQILDNSSLLPGEVTFLSKVAGTDPEQIVGHAKHQLDLSKRLDTDIITFLDNDYPTNLREAPSAPPILFVRGTLRPDLDRQSIAVVGSRDASNLGRKRASQLAGFMVGQGWVVISGLARGIDTAAHEGALRAGGRTLAVVGCGLDRTYPPENAELAARIAQAGAVISQFPFGTPPAAHNFPQRNKTMALLSLATVVIEAGEQSGAKMQADFALSTHVPQRRVFFPRSLVDAQGEAGWATQFLRRGAEVIEQVEDVLLRLQGPVVQQSTLPM